jgi:hypothetical protein
MSQTHSIVCHATKERLWIGQGTGPMTNFYSREPKTMEALQWFLQKNRDHALRMICNDLDESCINYLCWSGVYHSWRIRYRGVDLGVFRGTLPEAVKEALNDDKWRFLPHDVEYEKAQVSRGE